MAGRRLRSSDGDNYKSSHQKKSWLGKILFGEEKKEIAVWLGK